jgi:hypothetical protein
MATTDLIAQLRVMINDTTDPYEFDAPTLSATLDSAGLDLNKAAGTVWARRAAKYAGLVDVTEGSSSRKLSQLQAQALKMAEFYGADTSVDVTTTPARSGTRAITRP